MKFETKGIGTTWWIEIFEDDVNPAVFQEIEDRINAFEHLYSRFLSDSLISRLNKSKVLRDFPLELFSMLSYCQSISELTDYRFNVCSGSIQRSHGYDENYSFDESQVLDIEALRNGIVVLTPDEIKIHDAVHIDLGGIGKGWMVDLLKLLIESKKYRYYSINGGGDVYASSNHGDPVTFYMENPFDNSEFIGTIDLKDAAFACSSPSRRNWKTFQGNKYHHLVDATSGTSAEGIQSVFTYGSTALSADTASTCIFISPPHEAERLAESLEVKYLSVYPNGTYIASKGFPGTLHS